MQSVLRNGVRAEQLPGGARLYRFPTRITPKPSPVIEDAGPPSVPRGIAALVRELGWSLGEFGAWTEQRFGRCPLVATYRHGWTILSELADELERRQTTEDLRAEVERGGE